MNFQYEASHHQHELESEAEHERLVRSARTEGHQRSAFGRARHRIEDTPHSFELPRPLLREHQTAIRLLMALWERSQTTAGDDDS